MPGALDRYGSGQSALSEATLRSYTPSLRERAAYWLNRTFFGDDRKGQERANVLMNALDLTPVGLATGMYDAGRELGQGNALGALATAALTAAPVPAKGLGREAARLARAKSMGFHTDMPIQFDTAPANEAVRAPAIMSQGRTFTGHNHPDAVESAARELGLPFDELVDAPDFRDGFTTSAGRFISRHEAADIASRMGQGENTYSPATGLTSVFLKSDARPVAQGDFRTGATAQGLPGGQGVWGWALPVSDSAPQASALWHRAERPGQFDAQGMKDHEIRATLQEAWEGGHDAVLLRNYSTPDGKTGDVIVVRDRAQLRDPKAEFDPTKRNSANIMAGLAGAAMIPASAFFAPSEDEPTTY